MERVPTKLSSNFPTLKPALNECIFLKAHYELPLVLNPLLLYFIFILFGVCLFLLIFCHILQRCHGLKWLSCDQIYFAQRIKPNQRKLKILGDFILPP